MKIENESIHPFSAQETQAKKPARLSGTEKPQPAKPVSDAFSIELSPAAEQLNPPRDPDEISRARVAAIRDQLASGTYNISGKDVANKILGVLKK